MGPGVAMAIGAPDPSAARERALGIIRRVAGVMVAGGLRFDALRAVPALVLYARTPKLHQELLARLRDLGMLGRAPDGADPVERSGAMGRWEGAALLALGRRRVIAAGLFGALE